MPTVSAFRVLSSPGFAAWLSQVQASLAFTTYQIGKLFLIGRKSEDQLSVFERTFDRCLGLWTDSQSLWLASAFQLWRLENVLMRDGRTEDGYDRLFVPRASYTTGEIDVHDLAVDEDHNPVFVNTLFSCLATTSQRYSFRSIWHPPFLNRVQPEDACHLNGLAMQAGTARYVTACATTSTPSGWRDCRQDGGVVLDVSTNEIVARGLSMPHSPRLYRDDLWVLNSGTGYFGRVDRKTGTFEPLAFCPGYARGLSFIGNYAVIGLSRPREATFAGLELEDGLKAHQRQPQCGLIVLDLSSGRIVEWLSLEGRVEELYDVAVMPGVERPKAIGLKTDEIRHNVWHEENSFVVRWTANPKRHETDEEKSYEG